MDYKYFTSESVCEGHPDKICDLIADSILDEALSGDKNSRVACEVCCSSGMVLVMGEFSTEHYIDIPRIVRRMIREIGYDRPELGFDYNAAVLSYINQQSEDIARGIDNGEKTADKADNLGAGDQGMMFGYASSETKELMPLPVTLAHALTRRVSEARKSGEIKYLRPDGKAQVTVAYQDGKPVFVDTVVVSCQHGPDVDIETLRREVTEKIIKKAISPALLTDATKFYINPTGRFVKGGPHGDSGLTGRKIIVDTYGGIVPHGGGSFSGKDPTKVDRSASYYARYAAKNVVAAGLADRCLLQVAYAIGRAYPVSLGVDTFATGKLPDEQIEAIVRKVFDFRPYSIIEQLGLRAPIYAKTTNYGHFGKEGLPWERVDKIQELLRLK
ncbi:MAG: methionine adenosyltransferase [Firmicutes bacterium]|nr:methionine adenosyltransferase [Bacillota bacterium]